MFKLIPTTLIACAAFAFSAHAATITLDFEAAIEGGDRIRRDQFKSGLFRYRHHGAEHRRRPELCCGL